MPPNKNAPFQWFGGKGNLYREIIPYIPKTKVYAEPYCGAASIFWHLSPRPVEVLNDLNWEIVNLFRILQDKKSFDELSHRIIWTPYSVEEFDRALSLRKDKTADPITKAWAFYVALNQGFSGTAKTRGNWSRVFISSGNKSEVNSKWLGRMKLLPWFHERLQRVQLDCRDALEFIQFWDSPKTTFYIDPPYVLSTRKGGVAYDKEVDEDHHKNLAKLLLEIKGNAVLSGYDNPLYDPLKDAGWKIVRVKTTCSAAGKVRGSNLQGKGAATKLAPRTEVLWIKVNNRNKRTNLFNL